MPATIMLSLDHASDYVIMHEEGILQRPPWLSQPLCLVLSDAGKKGGWWLDVPYHTAAAHYLLHLCNNAAVSTSMLAQESHCASLGGRFQCDMLTIHAYVCMWLGRCACTCASAPHQAT